MTSGCLSSLRLKPTAKSQSESSVIWGFISRRKDHPFRRENGLITHFPRSYGRGSLGRFVRQAYIIIVPYRVLPAICETDLRRSDLLPLVELVRVENQSSMQCSAMRSLYVPHESTRLGKNAVEFHVREEKRKFMETVKGSAYAPQSTTPKSIHRSFQFHHPRCSSPATGSRSE